MTEARASELLAENLRSIYGFAYARLYDKDQVDDLSMEIVCEVLSSAKNIENDEAFWGFVWKVAQHTFCRFLRRKEKESKMVAWDDVSYGVYEQLSPEQEYIENETQSEEIFLLRRELSLLTKMHREVCVAFYIHNRSCSEIAKEQGISQEMVKYYLFKTRKILKEGIGMTRKLGEKSYDPGVFRLDFWGDYNYYYDMFQRKLPGAIMLAVNASPMTAEELSMELGVAMPYLEEELDILETAGVLKKNGNNYRSNIIIITDAFEKRFIKENAGVYRPIADAVYEDAKRILPEFRKLNFSGNDWEDNKMLFSMLNIAFMQGFVLASERSPIGKRPKLPLGGNGWIFGYDNDYLNLRFNAITLNNGSYTGDVRYSAVNYKAIENVQLFSHAQFSKKSEGMWDAISENAADEKNDTLPYLIEGKYISCENGILHALFPVFTEEVFTEAQRLLLPISERVADGMVEIASRAEARLSAEASGELKEQCADIAKVHFRSDVAARLLESLLETGKLILPTEPTPICVWGVKKN